MAPTIGIKIAVNGSETDVDVENDSATWESKIGNVRHTTGGGTWTKPGRPGVLQFAAAIPVEVAHLVRTITVAVSLDVAPSLAVGTTMDDFPPIVGTGLGAYRIIFHGDIQSAKVTGIDPRSGSNGDDRVQFDALSEMSGLLNRRARCAAATNTGITNMLAAIETAHGLTMDGADSFPTVANGFQNSDRPAQKRLTNGQYIATMLAGSGINMTEDWDGTITAPTLRWRADHDDASYYSGTVSDQWVMEIGYPWKMSYPDVGIVPGDYSARITVNGENSAGTQVYGYGELDTAALRAQCGERDTQVTSYIDTTTDCQKQAVRLIAYQGDAIRTRMIQTTLNTEVYYKALVDGGAYFPSTQADPAAEVFYLAAMMPGDLLYTRGHFLTDVGGSDGFQNGNSDYGNWPSGYSAGSGLYTTLYRLWRPYVEGWGLSDVATRHAIRAITRTFTPDGGWDVTYGVQPWTDAIVGSDVSAGDKGSGTD
jgi:hypothetical protein